MLFRKIKGITIVFTICAIFALFASQLQYFSTQRTATQNISFIIDPGHGIPDGGAVGTDGTTEQELNLLISLKLSQKLKELGQSNIMTRTDENSIYAEGKTIHEKKVSDIRERIKLASKFSNTPLISVHMNTYPSENVKGIQVFYSSKNEGSQELAQKLQTALNEAFQSDAPRTIKAIPNNIYLFSHIQNTAVIIECGFISNSEELKLLKNEQYQITLAEVIATTLAEG